MVVVYTVKHREAYDLGLIYLYILISGLLLWSNFDGFRLVFSVIGFLVTLSEIIYRKFCREEWEGVIAKETKGKTGICVICQGEFSAENSLIELSCHTTHTFHKNCISEWTKYKNECTCEDKRRKGDRKRNRSEGDRERSSEIEGKERER